MRNRPGYLQANLRSAFPRWSEREVEDLSKRIFRNFARNLVDYGRFHTITDEALDRLLPSVQHLHFLEESFAKGRGVILVTGHIGNWELGALFFGRHGFKINVVTIPEGSERIDSIRGAYRTAPEHPHDCRRRLPVLLPRDRGGAPQG